MNDDAKNALISYRMEKAAESVKAAQLMLDNKMLIVRLKIKNDGFFPSLPAAVE